MAASAELRLDESQWVEILAKSGKLAESVAATAAAAGPSSPTTTMSSQPQTVYLLALEGDAPDAKWKWWEAALNG